MFFKELPSQSYEDYKKRQKQYQNTSTEFTFVLPDSSSDSYKCPSYSNHSDHSSYSCHSSDVGNSDHSGDVNNSDHSFDSGHCY